MNKIKLNLPESTIYKVEVGSTAHGTGIPGQEDLDLIAVYVENPQQIFMLGKEGKTKFLRTQPEGVKSGPDDIDCQVYPLRKFVKLSLDGNPSILTAYWAPRLDNSISGNLLRDLGPSFIGRHIIPKYRGYLRSQVLKLLGLKSAPLRQELIAQFGYDTKFAMHASRLAHQCIELLCDWALTLPMDNETGDYLRIVRRGEVSFNEWFEDILYLDSVLETLLKDETIQYSPDYDKIYVVSKTLHHMTWEDQDLFF